MYHNTWQAVKDNIYDQSLLKDWDSWEHKFDDKIKTEADAIQYAAEMVNSLGDPYTRLQDAASVKEEYRNAEPLRRRRHRVRATAGRQRTANHATRRAVSGSFLRRMPSD